MRYLVVLLMLAGCATAESERAEEAARAEAYRQHVSDQCRSYGFTPGTEKFRDCVMRVDMQLRDQQQRVLQQMLLGR